MARSHSANQRGDGDQRVTHVEAIGQSPAFLDFQERLGRAAPIERPILLIGERGTGKEMAAKRLHFLSKRWGQPLVTLNCAALSPSLIESELFGHESGAFTGARQRRIGRFEAASGGTLFLDEISLIPCETQEKILRVVEYGTFERVGGSEQVQADVRIIGATNVNLAAEVQAGRFKSDLLDRLSFEVLFLPPLRERNEDIMILTRYFGSRMAYELDREAVPEFSPEAEQQLESWPWPGNVRELKNVVERAVYRHEENPITEIDFKPFRSPFTMLGQEAEPVLPVPDDACEEEPLAENLPTGDKTDLLNTLSDDGTVMYPEAMRKVELLFLEEALRTTRFNQRQAAEKLGLTYHQFRGLYRKYAEELNA